MTSKSASGLKLAAGELEEPDPVAVALEKLLDQVSEFETALNSPKTLNDVFDDLKITKPPVYESPEYEAVELARIDTEDGLRLARAEDVERIKADPDIFELAQKEIGIPGTRITDGRIRVETNPRMFPYLTRGRQSKPGTNEEIYRVEPVVYKSVNEISSLITNATYEPLIADDCDDETKAITEAFDRQLRQIRGGFDFFLQNAASLVKHGFANFEIIWGDPTDDDWIFPAALAFREQATVERWIFDQQLRFLEAVEYRVTGTSNAFAIPEAQIPRDAVTDIAAVDESPFFSNRRYIIPAGRTLATARTLIINLNATGNNIEGVSPIRVITGLRRMKELILQSWGIGAQKFLVPLALIKHQMVEVATVLIEAAGDQAHTGQVQTLINRLQNQRARLNAAIPVPPGMEVEYVSPMKDQPDVTPMLEYIDTMEALVFHNEGALLGSQSFGSFAMASVSDSKFLRAAPLYASRISCGLTDVLQMAIRFSHSDPESIETWPEYGFRFVGSQDASKFLEDLVKVVNSIVMSPVPWPPEALRMAEAKLGLKKGDLDLAVAAAVDLPSDSANVPGEPLDQTDDADDADDLG